MTTVIPPVSHLHERQRCIPFTDNNLQLLPQRLLILILPLFLFAANFATPVRAPSASLISNFRIFFFQVYSLSHALNVSPIASETASSRSRSPGCHSCARIIRRSPLERLGLGLEVREVGVEVIGVEPLVPVPEVIVGNPIPSVMKVRSEGFVSWGQEISMRGYFKTQMQNREKNLSFRLARIRLMSHSENGE